jgi:D-alanine-D-alanine ligase
MVKHPQSFASTAMTRNSRVENLQKLREQVKRICHRFGSARVEEFIEGPEFTVLVVDNPDDMECPFVYPPAELIFPPGENFLHSRVKWKEWVYLKPVKDQALSLRLMDMTRRMYLAMDGVGYARCDIRMGPDGQLCMIEINPNSGILFKPEDLGPADVTMEYDVHGHAGFLDRIFRAAVLRNKTGLPTTNNQPR